MNIDDLRKLAQDGRRKREAGIGLLIASGILGIFVLIPFVQGKPSTAVATATSTAPNAYANVPIQAKAAIVYDLATHQILYEKNAQAQLPLASLTKLLTVYAALQEFAPATPITIPEDVVGLSAPHAFTPGQTFTLENLARLTLTGSLNDGAAAIAEAVSTQEGESVHDSLASAAAALDLTQTYALNGNGLDISNEVSGGYGSAEDIAKLAGALVAEAPDIAEATTQSSTEAADTAGTVITATNTDPIVANVPGLILSKTGYTDLAGGNLALVFDVGIEHPIAVVVLGSTEDARFTDGQALVAATLAHFAGVASL